MNINVSSVNKVNALGLQDNDDSPNFKIILNLFW